MLTRIIVGVTLSALMLVVWLLGWVWTTVFFCLAMVMAAYEMISSLSKKGHKIHLAPVIAFMISLPLAAIRLHEHAIVFSLFIGVLVEFLQQIIRVDMDLSAMKSTIFVMVYPLSLIGTLPVMLISQKELAMIPVLLVVVVAAMTDTAAYFVGSFLGRTKLTPSISPKKTVEGSLGGVAGGVLSAIILYIIVNATASASFGFGSFLLIGFLGGIIGQVGDLAASLLKRSMDIKDYGSIFPGHGGVLDRMDSIMFIAAMVYMMMLFGI